MNDVATLLEDAVPQTILVVEDEVLIRAALADYLRDCGFHVLEAASGDEAKTLVERGGQPIDLVFSDIQMPGATDGFTLARWLRAHHPQIKVILTSGAVRSSQIAHDLCDLHPIEAKPYRIALVLQRIQTLLNRQQ